MIYEKYKNQLLTEVKKLDMLITEETDLEKLVIEIVQENNINAALELLKTLGLLAKRYPSIKMNDYQEKISELLFTYLGASSIELQIAYLKEKSDIPFSDLFNQLDELIGLDSVKKQVTDLIKYNKIQQLREKNGLKKSSKTLHMAFLGNPGTAKTTVARIVGRMYQKMGLLSKGHFIEVSRTDLIAEYQGQTAIKVKKLVNRAKGGVLFIDEAYSITENDNADSYGRESLTELTKALEDYREDLVVIVAGYTDLMNNFFDSNPGLKSRFNTFILFDDYSIDELVSIFSYICSKNDYTTNTSTLNNIREYFNERLKETDESFSNGRAVRNLFDDATMNQAKRLFLCESDLSKEALTQLLPEDIPHFVRSLNT